MNRWIPNQSAFETCPGWRVIAIRRIEQNPLSNDPAVPKGTIGLLQDEVDGYLWVDFGFPWGTVACDYDEVECYVKRGRLPRTKTMIGRRLKKGYRSETGAFEFAELPIWEILKFEYEEIGNEHIASDLEKLFGTSAPFETLLAMFQHDYGDAKGGWVTKKKEDALRYAMQADEIEDLDDLDEDEIQEMLDTIIEIKLKNGLIVAEDGDGGYLVIA